MPSTSPIQIPPLPQDTAGRWLDVIREDTDMVYRWLNVMYQMDGRYRNEGIGLFGENMAHRPSPLGASYYYWTPDSEIALRCVYLYEVKQHLVMSVGFVGALTPQHALDLIVERSIEYLRERNENSAVAVVPKQMDNAAILRLYDLVPTHPRVRVTTEAETRRFRRWRLDAPELHAP